MDLLVQLLANGLVNGSHYALLALGFGLIFGTTRVVHFAYGPVYALSAYGAWVFAAHLGAPLWLAGTAQSPRRLVGLPSLKQLEAALGTTTGPMRRGTTSTTGPR